MGIFDKLFGGKLEETLPAIAFGRYSDAFKQEAKYDSWDTSLSLFEENKYRESFEAFFDYLLDESQANFEYSVNGNVMDFKLLQGSKTITGKIGEEKIFAEARVARVKKKNIGMMRRMLELNFSLKYSRFAIDKDSNLTLIFDSYLLDGSPYKLYYALKEIAVNADKQDDLLLSEFPELEPINTGHLTEVSEEEKEVKYNYLLEQIKQVLEEIDSGKLNQDQYPGGIGYLLLDLAYRLDYLIKPEGSMMEVFERIHRLYFAPDGKSPAQKNLAMRKEFEELQKKTREDFDRELYIASSSFGITSPSNMQQLKTFIETELPNMDWYVENKHESVALAITSYILGYSAFNYAFQPPVKDMITLYFRVSEAAYFKALGFAPDFYNPETGELDSRALRQKLEDIEDKYRNEFPKLRIDAKDLQTGSLIEFGKSYLQILSGLDLEKKK